MTTAVHALDNLEFAVGLCAHENPVWWETPGSNSVNTPTDARRAIDICRACPLRSACPTTDRGGVIAGGVAHNQDGIPVGRCAWVRCGRQIVGRTGNARHCDEGHRKADVAGRAAGNGRLVRDDAA